ncbi:DNA-3-methyladenine glycosylase II [Parasphingorhabdus marina DSM 22363]|uniref:DNA-3-methyladenine glycosylase II n=1 Tax=Parasphingorhabdus marina DSM 22363 TaxID=1123272 RepID=A0A1N6CST5_9SPHN|nr:DNA-3-methyladenine glycosylase [Parasphingorhabdus marina]SIN61620.1 DNA-3-methyladenine glycosylase II [Parasphingorhabdus marina DSM 22363]
MGLSKETICIGLDAVAAREPRFASALARAGYPEPRINPPGYQTLLRTIVGQQVSVASAKSVWNKLEQKLGQNCPAEALVTASFDELRACGLSRQKQGYARSLAELILSGQLDLDSLPADDEEAIAVLTRVKGIGRWSAEIYLLFALGREDVWPAGDLAIRVGVGSIMGHDERPSEQDVRDISAPWSPHRGSVAIFIWHHYNTMVM